MNKKIKNLFHFKKTLCIQSSILFWIVFGIFFTIFASANSLEFSDELAQYSGTRSLLTFTWWSNNAEGMIFRKWVKYTPQTEIEFSWDYIYCDKQLLWYYYDDFLWVSIPLEGWLTGFDYTWWLYIACSWKNTLDIYGMIKYTQWQINYYIIAWTEYDFTGNTYIPPFSWSLKINNSGWYLWNNNLWIAKVSWVWVENVLLEDITPDSFSFNDMSDLELNSWYNTNWITVQGITTGIDISLSLSTSWYLLVNNVAKWNLTKIYSWDIIKIHFVTPNTYNTLTFALFDLSYQSESIFSEWFFYETKRAPDEPVAFDILNMTGQPFNTWVCTNTVTITWLQVAVTWTLNLLPSSSTWYMVVSWVSAWLTKTWITNWTTIQICLTTSSWYNYIITWNLSVWATSDSFSVTVMSNPDHTPPVFTWLWPVWNLTTYSTVLAVTTNETAICKYSNSNTGYSFMTNLFNSFNWLNFVASYTAVYWNNLIYIACRDTAWNVWYWEIVFTAWTLQMARFEVTINPPYFYSWQVGNITVRAVSNFGTTMTGYNWDIFMSLSGLNIGEYGIVNNWYYLFTTWDQWIKTFSSWLQINKWWNFTLKVYNILNESYGWTVTILVTTWILTEVGTFSFNTILLADPNKSYKSSEYIVAWLSYGTSVVVSTTKWILRINNQPYGSTWLVKNWDSLKIELLSSPDYNVEVFSQVTIWSQFTRFRVITRTKTNYTVPFELNSSHKFYLGRIVNTLLYSNSYAVWTTQWLNLVKIWNTKLDEKINYYSNYYSSDSKTLRTARKNEVIMRYLKLKTDTIVKLIQDSYTQLNYKYVTIKKKTYQVNYDYKIKWFYSPDFTPRQYFSTKASMQGYLNRK